MTARSGPNRRIPTWLAAICAAALTLTGCGGGGSATVSGGAVNDARDCSLAAQKTDLRDYLRDWYYFTPQDPDPAAYTTIESYFDALLASTDPWSYVEPTSSFTQFFSAGETLGYGVSVAGRSEDPVPVRIRFIAPGSPAALAGLKRGMVVESINGTSAETLKGSSQGFGDLSAASVGQQLTLTLREAGSSTSFTRTLTAAVYALQPVDRTASLTSAGGRKVAYLHFKDFVSTARNGLATFLQAAQGSQDLILDLRYNGGGLVSVARDLASGMAGNLTESGQAATFVQLVHNIRHLDSNQTYAFSVPSGWNSLGLQRLYVLAGPRTCSASELVVNGLRPFMSQVIQIGGTTCGKPYGFRPADLCGNTYSAVLFESLNARGQGGYTSGLAPTSGCSITDDLDHALGDPAEALVAAALRHIDTGSCQSNGSTVQAQRSQNPAPRTATPAEGERRPGTLLAQ